MKSEDEDANLISIGWKDLKLFCFVCTRGVTSKGNPVVHVYHHIDSTGPIPKTVINQVEVDQPRVVEEYHEGCGVVDLHNHLRQGCLDIERTLKTKCWYRRLFYTILGICVTDSSLAFQHYSQNHKRKHETLNSFLSTLCFQLIFRSSWKENQFIPQTPRTARITRYHRIDRLKNLDELESIGDPRYDCVVCSRRTRYY